MRRLNELYAFVMWADGVEGVIPSFSRAGVPQPMMTDDLAKLQVFRAEAEALAVRIGVPFTTARFVRTDER